MHPKPLLVVSDRGKARGAATPRSVGPDCPPKGAEGGEVEGEGTTGIRLGKGWASRVSHGKRSRASPEARKPLMLALAASLVTVSEKERPPERNQEDRICSVLGRSLPGSDNSWRIRPYLSPRRPDPGCNWQAWAHIEESRGGLPGTRFRGETRLWSRGCAPPRVGLSLSPQRCRGPTARPPTAMACRREAGIAERMQRSGARRPQGHGGVAPADD